MSALSVEDSFDPFRNVEGSRTDSLETWPYEALVATLERGGVREWRPVLAEIRRRPWGVVARQIEQYLDYGDDHAVVALFSRAISSYREQAQARERSAVADRVRECLKQSGLTSADFAERIGTSASRFSTYVNGRVTPSATLMLRIEECARDQAQRRGISGPPAA